MYPIRITFGGDFNLANLANFMSANTDNNSFLLTLFAKLNAGQFALHSNSPNLMFAKCTAYIVYDDL